MNDFSAKRKTVPAKGGIKTSPAADLEKFESVENTMVAPSSGIQVVFTGSLPRLIRTTRD